MQPLCQILWCCADVANNVDNNVVGHVAAVADDAYGVLLDDVAGGSVTNIAAVLKLLLRKNIAVVAL